MPPAGEPPRVLILGGTGEARELAATLLEAGLAQPVTSLAGATEAPILPLGEVRSGGFGGAAGLAAYLAGGRFCALIDATHPFATQISRHAREAAAKVDLPRLRLERPPWSPGPGDDWRFCADLDAALTLLPGLARTVLATVGRRSLPALAARPDFLFVVRGIERPDAVPANVRWLQGRPPFTVAAETALLADHRIEALIVRDSGGAGGRAKLEAAGALGLPVLMLRRPAAVPGPSASSVGEAVAWLRAPSAPRPAAAAARDGGRGRRGGCR